MRRVALWLGIVALLSGFGGAASSVRVDGVSVTVKLLSHKVVPGTRTTTQVDTFTLACDPPSGTLPFAARVCRDIREHPLALLSPPEVRRSCIGPTPMLPDSAVAATVPFALEVSIVAGGRSSALGGDLLSTCEWPGGTTLAYYLAVAEHRGKALPPLAGRLGCGEDPVLLARPTPWPLVYRCMGWRLQTGSSPGPMNPVLKKAPWLAVSMRRTVVGLFGGVHPTATEPIDFGDRVVVLFEFDHVVDCATCGDDPISLAGPTAARVFRVSYDRATHRGLVTRLCSSPEACR